MVILIFMKLSPLIDWERGIEESCFSFPGGGVPNLLQEVQVPVIENSVCQEMFHTAGHSKVILNSFLCAGYANGQKDSCEV
jgi:Trypsin.